MKRILLSCLLLLSIHTLKAQDTRLNNVVNTLKERITLAGYAQVGYTYDDAGEKASNTFDLKRAIFMARGKITDKWSCYFMYSFANTGKILEAYTEYRFLPQLTARIGQFKTMYTIENPMSPCFVELINCYSQAVNYLAGINGSDPLYGSNSGRDMGILIYGDLFKKKLSYNLAVMNGQGINLKDKNNQKDIVGSLIGSSARLAVGGRLIRQGQRLCRSRLFRQSGYSDRRQLHTQPLVGRRHHTDKACQPAHRIPCRQRRTCKKRRILCNRIRTCASQIRHCSIL